MTNEEAAKMLGTMQRTVYLGNRKFEDAIECAVKALSEPLQPWEVLAAQAVLSQPAEPKRGKWIDGYCSECGAHAPFWAMASTYHKSNFCPNCGADMRGEQDEP